MVSKQPHPSGDSDHNGNSNCEVVRFAGVSSIVFLWCGGVSAWETPEWEEREVSGISFGKKYGTGVERNTNFDSLLSWENIAMGYCLLKIHFVWCEADHVKSKTISSNRMSTIMINLAQEKFNK